MTDCYEKLILCAIGSQQNKPAGLCRAICFNMKFLQLCSKMAANTTDEHRHTLYVFCTRFGNLPPSFRPLGFFLGTATVRSLALVSVDKWYRHFREFREFREKREIGNTAEGITFFPKTIHRNEPFYLNSSRNYRKFHSNGKRS